MINSNDKNIFEALKTQMHELCPTLSESEFKEFQELIENIQFLNTDETKKKMLENCNASLATKLEFLLQVGVFLEFAFFCVFVFLFFLFFFCLKCLEFVAAQIQ